MTYRIVYTNKFKKDLRRCAKRGLDLSHIAEAISILSQAGTLPASYRQHSLSGSRKGLWECHIEPDWLMIWEQNDTELILLLLETGTHSDLF